MRVTFLTHYYPPEVGAPQTRIEALARGLASHGVEVTIHTCPPHYPGGEILEPYRNRPYLVERHGEIRVVRTAVYPAANRGSARRLLNHASFATSAVVAAPRLAATDVVVTESPPLFTAAGGVAYAALKRAPLVLNVADRWPASAVQLGMLRNRQAIRLAETLERWCYRHARAITVPTRGLASTVAATPGAAGKVTRVAPAVDLDQFHPAPRQAGQVLRVLYAGTVGLAQGLEIVIEAAQLAGPDVVEVTIAGDGAQAAELATLVARRRVANVTFLGGIAHDRVPDLYAKSDAALIALRARPVFEGALPTKLFEAMACGRAVIACARGETARLVEDASAGIVVEPEDARRLAAAFQQLQRDPHLLATAGENARRHAQQHHGRARMTDDYLRLLERVTSEGTAPARRRGFPVASH